MLQKGGGVMCINYKEEDAIRVYVVDSLESFDLAERDIRLLKKKYMNSGFKIEISNKLNLLNGEKVLIKDAPPHVVDVFDKDKFSINSRITNYYSRRLIIYLIDKSTGKCCSEESVDRITQRYDFEKKSYPNGYNPKKEFKLIKSDINDLLDYLDANYLDNLLSINFTHTLGKDDLLSISGFFKECSSRINDLIYKNKEF